MLLNALSTVYRAVRPPARWRLAVIVALGVIVGIGFFLVHISNAFSYLSDDSATCLNCHIMAPEYASWNRSSHREWATCNDCHVPHDNLVRTYWFKAKDGMRHATMFTLRMEPHAIMIKEEGKHAVQENCIRCHWDLVHNPRLGFGRGFEERWCWECHRGVPHGRTRSLSSVPNARVPTLGTMLPEWMNDDTNK